MMKAWEKNIRKVVPYVPGEQPNKERMIKLNTNENPYPPAPGVAEALKNLEPDRLRLYPDPACTRLVDAIAKQKGLKPEQIFVGVGSDDVLAMCFMTFFNSENQSCFRILPILFTMFGRRNFVFRMRHSRWMMISISEKRIIIKKTVV